jgi:hypothetical protein
MRSRITDHAPDRSAGFTLLETILALGITFLVVTTAFAIVNSCLELGDSVNVTRSSREDAAAVEELFRSFFASLPPEANLEVRVTGRQDPLTAEIRVQEAPALAGSLLAPGPTEVLVIQTSEEPGGTLRLEAGVSEGRIGSPRRGPVRGFVVLGGITRCDWRFYQQDADRWESSWIPDQGRPRFVELVFAQRRLPPERWVFPVPRYSRPADPSAPPQTPPEDDPPDPDETPDPNPDPTPAPAP